MSRFRWGRERARTRMAKQPAASDAAARKTFFKEAGPLTRYLSVEAKGLTFIVETNDRLGRGLFVRRWRQDFRHLDRAVRLLSQHGLLREGSTFVDVGANIGTTTVRAVRRHGFARAVALEPAPANFRTLRLNLVANEIDSRVTALQAAALNREGQVELALSSRSSGAHMIAALTAGDSAEMITVQAVMLDGLAERGVIDPDSVGLLWIDAQGAEGMVLEGASALLERELPIAMAVRPTLPNWDETKQTLIRLLSGYTDFADLRHAKPRPNSPAQPLDSVTANGDLLAFRR